MGCLCGRNDLLVRGVRFSHRNVVPDASASKPGLLQHHTVVVPKALACQLLQRNIADFDRAAVHIIKTHQQIDQRRLAASISADNPDAFPWICPKRDIF